MNTPLYPFQTQEERDRYNQRKRQESADHARGYVQGGPVDETQSISYQYGQLARLEDDAEREEQRPWWKFWQRLQGERR